MARFVNFFGSIENNSGGAVQFRDSTDSFNTLLLPDSTETFLTELSSDIFNIFNFKLISTAGFGNFTFRDGDNIVISDREVILRYDELRNRFAEDNSFVAVERESIVGIMFLDVGYFSLDGPITNSTETYEDVINQSLDLEKGLYVIDLAYGWNHDQFNTDIETILNFDGTVLGDPFSNGVTHKQQPTQSSGTGGGSGTSQQYFYYAKFEHEVTTAGSKTLQLQYRTDNAGDMSTLWNVSISIKKMTL